MVGGGIVSVPPLCAGNKGEHFKWNGPISQRRAATLGFFLIEQGHITSTFHNGDDRQGVVIPCLVFTREGSSHELEA